VFHIPSHAVSSLHEFFDLTRLTRKLGHVLCSSCCHKIIEEALPRLQPACPFCRDHFTRDDVRLIRIESSASSGWTKATQRLSSARSLISKMSRPSVRRLRRRGLPRRLQLQRSFENETAAASTSHDFSCAICLDEHPVNNRVDLDCYHAICRDCTRGHVCAKIEEHSFPVFCPVCMMEQNDRPGGMCIHCALIAK